MTKCTCPPIHKIPDDERLYLYPPAVATARRGTNNVGVFHRDCPIHGWIRLEDNKEVAENE